MQVAEKPPFTNEKILSNVLAYLLIVFGVTFSYFVAITYVKPRRTWTQVVKGDLVLDIVNAVDIYNRTGNVVAALIPLRNHILAGVPMIAGQEIKHYLNDKRADAELEKIKPNGA